MPWTFAPISDRTADPGSRGWSSSSHRRTLAWSLLVGLLFVVAFWLTVPQATASAVALQVSLAAVALLAVLGAPRAPAAATCAAVSATGVAWLLGLTSDPFTIAAACLYLYARRYGRSSLARILCIVIALVFLALLALSVGGAENHVRSALLSYGALASAWVLGVRTRRENEAAAARAEAEERLRLSRDVHDVLSHTLGVIGVRAGVAAHLPDGDLERRDDALRDIERSAREGIEQLHAVLDRRRSGDVVEQGTSQERSPTRELNELADVCRQAGLQAEVVLTGDVDGLSAPIGTTVHRVAREATTNVIRHAHASQITISVSVEPTRVEVRVADDGRGGAQALRPGHGLDGLRARVELVGGETEIADRPDGGLVIAVTIPVQGDGGERSSW